MKKWLTLMLCAIFVFTLIPTTYAKHGGQASFDQKDKGKKKEKVQKASGKVTAVDASNGKITVEAKGKTMELIVTSSTTIKISEVKNPALSNIWTGDKISAEYVNENSVNTAKKISISKQKGSLKGQVEAVDTETKSLTVAGKQLVVTGEAVIFINNEKVTFEDIVKGDKIEAKGFMKEGILQASSLKIKRKDDMVKGKIESIDLVAGSIVVDGKTLLVTEKTKMESDEKQIGLPDLLVGESVEAKAWKKSETEWIAVKLEVKRDDEDDDGDEDNDDGDDGDKDKEGEVKGKVEAIDTSAKTLTIKGKIVQITEKTRIKGEKGKEVSLDTIEIGCEVEVEVECEDD